MTTVFDDSGCHLDRGIQTVHADIAAHEVKDTTNIYGKYSACNLALAIRFRGHRWCWEGRSGGQQPFTLVRLPIFSGRLNRGMPAVFLNDAQVGATL